jgi:hypothetical protein
VYIYARIPQIAEMTLKFLRNKSLLDRVESVDADFQEFGNRNDMKRARLEDAAAATILQVEEHGYLGEAEVLRRSFHFCGIGSWAERRYSSLKSATLRSDAGSPPI